MPGSAAAASLLCTVPSWLLSFLLVCTSSTLPSWIWPRWHRGGGGRAGGAGEDGGACWDLGRASSTWKAALLQELILSHRVSTANAMTVFSMVELGNKARRQWVSVGGARCPPRGSVCMPGGRVLSWAIRSLPTAAPAVKLAQYVDLTLYWAVNRILKVSRVVFTAEPGEGEAGCTATLQIAFSHFQQGSRKYLRVLYL